MLDHQDGAIGGDATDQRGDALDVFVAHARHRLVEQQHFGIERQGRRDLQRALAAIGDFAGDRIGEFGRGRRRRAVPARARSAASAPLRAPEIELSPRLRCSAMRTFSSAVRCGNTAEIWNERTRPSRATSAGRIAVMSRPLNGCARSRRDEFGQHIEAGRLAGAVGADQGVDRAAPDRKIDVADRREIAEGLAEALGDKDVVLAHRRRPSPRMRFPRFSIEPNQCDWRGRACKARTAAARRNMRSRAALADGPSGASGGDGDCAGAAPNRAPDGRSRRDRRAGAASRDARARGRPWRRSRPGRPARRGDMVDLEIDAGDALDDLDDLLDRRAVPIAAIADQGSRRRPADRRARPDGRRSGR